MSPNPFGEDRRSVKDRLKRDGTPAAPRRYAAVAAAITFATGLVVTSSPHMDHTTKALAIILSTAIPPAVVEWWWRRRKRREEEQLLVLGETPGATVRPSRSG